MRRAYRYRLYPTARQALALTAQLEQACDLYNAALEHRKWLWRDHGMSTSFGAQCAELRYLRADGLLNPAANFWSQQHVLRRLDHAFSAFYRRCKAGETPGYPRFKPRRRFNTLTWSFAGNSGGCALVDERLRLQGVGRIKIKWHRQIPAAAKLCTVQVTRKGDRWYACFSLDDVPATPLWTTGRVVGVDLGITTFVALSTGELVAGPRANRAGAAAVRRAARKVSRRKRGSNRRRKAAVLLARQREREANRRRDHAHKTARMLVERFDLIAVENLNHGGLAKGMLARDCNDQGWAGFIGHLRDKAESAGREVVMVDARNTSQACSACGVIVPKALSVRVHSCACGYRADRDVNAARNVLAKAIGPDGAFGRERWGEEARAVAREAACSSWRSHHVTLPLFEDAA